MISVQDLTKYYDEPCVLDGISFEVQKGEILGLLGPNGAGKTTMLRILTCFLLPSSGTVKIKNFDIYRNPLEIKKLIGYLPENAPVYQEMLVYDYLQYIAASRHIHGENKRNRIHELADVCGLNEVMHNSVKELSRGYKQRVGLAHAMMSDPEILIMDEPTAGLDPNQIVEIRSIIKEAGQKKTVIMSTHILNEAEATCDRIVIINQGKVVADGISETLRSTITGDYTFQLTLLEANFGEVKALLSSLPGVRAVSRLPSEEEGRLSVNSLRVHLRCQDDIRDHIYRRIQEKDWIVIEFLKQKRSLENVFRELTTDQR